ncbi:MAG: EF-hand domain-containing protein [Phenylobacterium sp.]
MSVQPRQPRLKKSETLEIRLPYPTKLAFMARCRDEGRSASEALRGFIDGAIAPGQAELGRAASRAPQRLAVGALIAAAVGAMALPSLAHTNQRAAFDCLARDHAAISPADLARLDADHDGKISYAEFQAACAK